MCVRRARAEPTKCDPECTAEWRTASICLMSYIRYHCGWCALRTTPLFGPAKPTAMPHSPGSQADPAAFGADPGAALQTPAFSPLYLQIKGLILQSL